MFCLHVKYPLPPGDNPIAVNKYYYYYIKIRIIGLLNFVLKMGFDTNESVIAIVTSTITYAAQSWCLKKKDS